MDEVYQKYFRSMPCYLTVQDKDFFIVDANDRFVEDFGEFQGRHCYEVYKHRNEVCIPCPVQKSFEDAQVHSSEELVTPKGGEPMNVIVYTAPIPDDSGEITRVMEMSTNITTIRKLQSQLESIGLLIGSMSHGIKGLLNGLDGGMYLVNSGMKKGAQDRIQKGWEMVQRNVDRIRSQVLNILYYTKERTPHWETIRARDLAEDVARLIEPKALELQIGFETRLEPDTGDVEVDPQAIRAMLVNLLENALDACRVDKKKGAHRVVFSLTGGPSDIRFAVEDNGIGMDRETREKAFSLFFSSKGAKGTGLGLFISNNIVRAHGGTLELISELDKGSRFEIMIPRKRAIEEPA